MTKITMEKRRFSAALLITILSTIAFTSISIQNIEPANAQSCGSTVTSSVVVTSDLLGCSGDGLIVGADNIIIDLDGHTISGSGTSGSVGVNNPHSGVTIKDGTITGFEAGVGLLGPCPASTSGNTVQDLTLTSNSGAGIHIACSNSNVIKDNTITSTEGLGIFIDNGGNNEIKDNTITGHIGTGAATSFTTGSTNGPATNTGAGIEIHIGPSSTVEDNTITGNTNGLVMDGFSSSSTIEDNHFSSNTQDGFVTIAGGNTIKDNEASNNGRDGIAVAQGSSNCIKDNTANSNGRDGIRVGKTGDTFLGFVSGNNNRVEDNTALSNSAFDLFWDTSGSDNGWIGNTFSTSSPATLPTPTSATVVC